MDSDRNRPPVVRPYFYDSRGRIRKNSSTESLLRVAITKLPILIPKITLPTERFRPFKPRYELMIRRSVSRYRNAVQVVGSCGLEREVFVMEDGTKVDELRHFPGFRYVIGQGEDEEQRFWTECWDQFRSLKYKYIFLTNGKRIHSIQTAPEGTKLVLVSSDLYYKGVKLRQEPLRLRPKESFPVPIQGAWSTQSSPKRCMLIKSQSTLSQPKLVD